MYAGNVLARVQSTKKGPFQVLSVRPTSFDKAPLVDATSVETVDGVAAFDKAEWKSEQVSKSDRPDLGSASIVVSGGRGIKSGDNFPILEKLADKLGAAVGASRAAVDAGFCPNDWQVGQVRSKICLWLLLVAAAILLCCNTFCNGLPYDLHLFVFRLMKDGESGRSRLVHCCWNQWSHSTSVWNEG
jgi:electron transfer flavoprotein alpha subunit